MKLGEQFRSEVVTCAPSDTLQEAAWYMKDENVGAVVVVSKPQRKVVGILTDRDIALKLALGEAEPTTPVEQVMTKQVLTIWDDQGIFNATQYMMGHRVRRLPIIDHDERLVGMVTLDDLLALLADEMRNLGRVISPVLSAKESEVA